MNKRSSKVSMRPIMQIRSTLERPRFGLTGQIAGQTGVLFSCSYAAGLLALYFLFAGTVTADAFNQKSLDRLEETKSCLRCDLRWAKLSGADLEGSKLAGAYLIKADLQEANLAKANLGGARLAGANLRGANLRNANLRFSSLIGTDLTQADLRGSNLRNARLSRAVLTRTNLKDANLQGAQLQDALLREVRGLTQRQLSQACGDSHTSLPSGLSIPTCQPEHR